MSKIEVIQALYTGAQGGVDFSRCEEKLGIIFNNKELLVRAFTHRSFLNEHRDIVVEHNERLEFLGDAVVELSVARALYERFPDKPEGELTAYRVALVNTITISNVATAISLNDFLLLSKGEAKDVGRARQYILANTFESFIGALYLDHGYDVADQFIAKHLLPLTTEVVEKSLWQDAKSKFQEKSQEIAGVTPSYSVLKETGPDHDKSFVVGVFLKDVCVAKGTGKSKQEGEQDAAVQALKSKGW